MRLTLQQIHTLKSDLGELAEYRLDDEYLDKEDLNERGLSRVESELHSTLSIFAARDKYDDTPDTVVIDITGGVVDEISSNHDVNVILLDSDLESLDVESADETFELNGTIYATRDTGLASYNPSRTELVYNSVQERDARVQAQRDTRIQTELLTQADYDRFNEIFRVETLALGRSVIKSDLRGHEYVEEEVFGKEEKMRLIPLKVQGQQFELNAPIIKPVAEMIADFVKLSKLHDFDAKATSVTYFNQQCLDTTELKPPLRRDVVESLFNMEYNDVERTMTYDEQAVSLKRILKSAPCTVEQAMDLIHAELHQ